MNAFEIRRKPISDQVLVVTDASSGVGLATARYAAKRGAKVVLSSQKASEMEDLVSTLRSEGGDVFAVPTDVSHYEDIVRLRDQAIQHYGRIDTWINNVCEGTYGKLSDLELEEEKRIFDVNFWSVRNGSRIALGELCKSVGVLINVESGHSPGAEGAQGIYVATKQAVKAYTDSLRLELEGDDVPVAVCFVHADPAENLAARTIVKCAERPRRDVSIGGTSKLASLREFDFLRLGLKKVRRTDRGTELWSSADD